MKRKALDGIRWEWKDGKLYTRGSKDIKSLNTTIYFEVEVEPQSGAGKIEFSALSPFLTALNTEVEVTGGTESLEQAIESYYAWVKDMWFDLPMADICKAREAEERIVNRSILQYISENGGFNPLR